MFNFSRVCSLSLVALLGLLVLAACTEQTSVPTSVPVAPLTPSIVPIPPTALPAYNYSPTARNTNAIEITGGGSTFAQSIYENWFNKYKEIAPNVKLSYIPSSSGVGRSVFLGTPVTTPLANNVRPNAPSDFAGSDAAFTGQQLVDAQNKSDIVHIPIALGGVVVAYRLDGFKGELRLSGSTLAQIYLGTITRWDDPTILVENPGNEIRSAGAGKNIKVIIRQRGVGSGTTEIFSRYLAAISADFRDKVGPGSAPSWPNFIGLQGDSNEKIAELINNNDGGLGYVDLNAADDKKLTYASIRNLTGRYIRPDSKSVTAAAQGVSIPDDFRIFVVNAEGESAYPISGFTWLIVWKDFSKMPTPSQQKAQAMFDFLWWALHEGQSNLPAGYAALPPSLIPRLESHFFNSDPKKVFQFSGNAIVANPK